LCFFILIAVFWLPSVTMVDGSVRLECIHGDLRVTAENAPKDLGVLLGKHPIAFSVRSRGSGFATGADCGSAFEQMEGERRAEQHKKTDLKVKLDRAAVFLSFFPRA
jgi:hypothetical protein